MNPDSPIKAIFGNDFYVARKALNDARDAFNEADRVYNIANNTQICATASYKPLLDNLREYEFALATYRKRDFDKAFMDEFSSADAAARAAYQTLKSSEHDLREASLLREEALATYRAREVDFQATLDTVIPTLNQGSQS